VTPAGNVRASLLLAAPALLARNKQRETDRTLSPSASFLHESYLRNDIIGIRTDIPIEHSTL
jgi:hypothetical protein